MKMTNLEMVQNILSSMDSDEVTAITDTAEAEQVLEVIKETSYQLVSNQIIPEHKTLARLTSAGAALVFMAIPATVHKVLSFRYNKIRTGETDANWSEVCYKSPAEFLRILTSRKGSDTNVVSATDPTSTIALDLIVNDAPPTYWTSFDDAYIVCDSYDAVVDASGLVGTKTLCEAVVEPTTWSDADAFTPDIDDNFFPLLLAEAKSLCWLNHKQRANPKIERQARNQKVYLQNDKYRTERAQKADTGSTGPNFGRRRR